MSYTTVTVRICSGPLVLWGLLSKVVSNLLSEVMSASFTCQVLLHVDIHISIISPAVCQVRSLNHKVTGCLEPRLVSFAPPTHKVPLVTHFGSSRSQCSFGSIFSLSAPTHKVPLGPIFGTSHSQSSLVFSLCLNNLNNYILF